MGADVSGTEPTVEQDPEPEQDRRRVEQLPDDALDHFEGDELRARCFIEKYAMWSEDGKLLETHPSQMWRRVAETMASVEADEGRWAKEFEWLLSEFRFVPGGRILHGAGNPRDVTMTNCYYTAIANDSLEAIFDWCKSAARTYSYGGGNGVDIGVLRPEGSPVHNAARTSSGAVSFMELFSTTTGTIGQHGRRGALMITCPVWHPDIEAFVDVKSHDLDSVRYANISVKATDDFMEAVKEGRSEYTLRFDNDVVEMERTIDPRALFDKIVRSAHKSAEPGVIFWDNVTSESPSEYCAPVEGTNPCGEQPLESNGACTLGHVNLSAFVNDPFLPTANLDWEGLERAVRLGVRFLDDVVEVNLPMHAHDAQAEQARKTRRVGLGVTGLGDMLAKLKVRYDTDEALDYVDALFERIRNWAYDASVDLAKEKEPFPLFDADQHLQRPFVQRLPDALRDRIGEHGLRNVCILTVAPVGSGSVLAGTSSGVEPIFSLRYRRRSESLSKENYDVEHHLVRQYIDQTGTRPDELPDVFVTSHEIDPFFRVRMQATIQRYVDSAISSTVNLPEDIDVDTVKEIYVAAWEQGCKGITVYREGSREGILITEDKAKAQDEDAGAGQQAEPAEPAAQGPQTVPPGELKPRDRPDVVSGTTQKIQTPYGSLYVTINEDAHGLFEVFAQIGRGGGYTASFTEALARMASLCLRSGIPVDEVIDQLEGIRSPKVSWDHGEKVHSVPDAIAKAIKRHVSGRLEPQVQSRVDQFKRQVDVGKGAVEGQQQPPATGDVRPDTEPEKEQRDEGDAVVKAGLAPECPDCMATLVFEEGCVKCLACGYSEC